MNQKWKRRELKKKSEKSRIPKHGRSLKNNDVFSKNPISYKKKRKKKNER